MVTLCVWPDVGLYRAANLEVLREVLVDLGADSARAVLALLAGDPARHAIVRVHLVEGHLQPLRYLRRGNQRAQQLSAGAAVHATVHPWNKSHKKPACSSAPLQIKLMMTYHVPMPTEQMGRCGHRVAPLAAELRGREVCDEQGGLGARDQLGDVLDGVPLDQEVGDVQRLELGPQLLEAAQHEAELARARVVVLRQLPPCAHTQPASAQAPHWTLHP